MEDEFDFLIIGAGLFGSVCAYELTRQGYSCLVIDRNSHIGGNCFTQDHGGIHVHKYGPHIFHTSDDQVWQWINQFTEFNDFTLRPVANYNGELYSLPFNMWTFHQLWGVTTPQQAKEKIQSQRAGIANPANLEQQALATLGSDIYNKLIKGYTEKQWRTKATNLPREIIQRLPIRFTYDSNYFNDKYQGIPVNGYTQIFRKLLDKCHITLNVDYLTNRNEWDSKASTTIFTGAIDQLFNYKFGALDYKTLAFEFQRYDYNNYQGTAMMNFTSGEVPYTRIIEHKHFNPSICDSTDFTIISREYPVEYVPGVTTPLYPVNNSENNALYQRYKALADAQGLHLGGRLAQYKYFDMDDVIREALHFVRKFNRK